MLVLSRKPGESLIIGDGIKVTVVDVKGDSVKIGIEAPKDVPVWRQELVDGIENSNREAATSPVSLDKLSKMMRSKKNLQN